MTRQPVGWIIEKGRAIRWTYGLCALALIASYPLLPEVARQGVLRLVSVTSLVAAIVGTRANTRPDHPRRWIALLVVGLVVANLALMVELVPGETANVLGEVLDTIGNVILFGAAMVALSTRLSQVGAVIDVALIGLALGGVIWNFVLLPTEQAEGRPIVSEVDALLVVVSLAGVLGAAVRLRLASDDRLTPLWIVSAGLAFSLIAHIVDAVVDRPRAYPPIAMPLMVAYACVALFCLDPASFRLFRPKPAEGERLSRARLWFLGIAVATIPVALGVSILVGGYVNGALLVFGGGLATVLVMIRIRWLSAERLHAEEAFRHLASHDPLTGLINRREFMTQLNAEQSRDAQCAMLFCDIDKFKHINDRFGHSAGDRLLVEVGQRLVASVRESDTVARLGGDEFIILLRNAGHHEIDSILERISAVLSQPITVNGHPVQAKASIGVVAGHWGEPEELLRRADHAMYKAKQSEPTQQRGVRIVSA